MSYPFKVINHNFPVDQYKNENTEKHMAFLHHTVSGKGVQGDINWWEKTSEQVATCVIGARNGDLHTLFSSEKWAHHLGVKNYVLKQFGISYWKNYSERLTHNQWLNKISIGYELDSAGGLVKRNGKYYSDFGSVIPKEDVVEYDYYVRGYRFYEKYTDNQLRTLEYVLKHWNDKYGIPLDYNPEMWNLSEKALKGESGIWSHVSVRPDKNDCHPYPPLIEMLKSLSK